jgi:hypothetical protein
MLKLYGTVIAALFICLVCPAKGEEDATGSQTLIDEALFRETSADNAGRSELLVQAEQSTSDNPGIHWARGHILMHDRWLTPEQVSNAAREDTSAAAYRLRRAAAGNDAEDQWKLAQWCKENDLPLQQSAHLARVVYVAPNHTAAWREAGFSKVRGAWIRPKDVMAAKEAADAQRALFRQWRPVVERIQQRLLTGKDEQRQAADKDLKEITSLETIEVIENQFCSSSPPLAARAIELMSAVDDPQVSLALARQAIHSPWQVTRDLASAKLRQRPLDDFAPLLLGALRNPVDGRMQMDIDEVGRVVLRKQLYVETPHAHEVLETQSNIFATHTSVSRRPHRVFVESVVVPNVTFYTDMARENLARTELNDRIIRTLATVTGKSMGDEPQAWWNWWNNTNELYTPEKPVLYEYHRATLRQRFVSFCSCFVKGTPVWTVEGMRPIEEIVAGDLVLATNVVTGELAYKPVLHTTVRPPAAIVRIEGGDRLQIDATGGHRFWVAGEGWVKARDLKSGMPLHTATGALLVSEVSEQPAAVAYNLVVDEFHNYFVTEAKVLCQDNLMPWPTAVKVPGLRHR